MWRFGKSQNICMAFSFTKLIVHINLEHWFCVQPLKFWKKTYFLKNLKKLFKKSNEILSVPVTFSVEHDVGGNIRFSPNGVKCVPLWLFNVFIQEKHRLINLSFRVHFSLSRKVDITTECSCSKFVIFYSKYFLRLLFIKLVFFRCNSFQMLWLNFLTLFSSVPLSKSIHWLLGREIRVKFKYFVMSRPLYTWLNRDADIAVFNMLPFCIFFQRNAFSIRYTDYSKV